MSMEDGKAAITLESVTRKYGAVTALKGISLEIPQGQLIGLLGRNGAGKTTALNLMTGYLPPTAGRVRILGTDMMEAPRECKRHIGYLPEHPPLYDEMTVEEYLLFACELKEVVRSARKEHTEEILELCGLQEVQKRLLGHLSKGYRQRAGIAQALCGSPEILILDEPTVGLDPRQTAEMRELIRRLGKKRTVLFSSHLLGEVQQLCERVVILHEGRIAGDLEPQRTEGGKRLITRTAGEAERAAEALRTVPGIAEVHQQGSGAGNAGLRVILAAEAGDERVLDAIFRKMAEINLPIREMREDREPLEELFLRLTQ